LYTIDSKNEPLILNVSCFGREFLNFEMNINLREWYQPFSSIDMRIPSKLIALGLLFYSAFAFSQNDPALLTIDHIYNSKEFSQERFGPARWVEGGKAYTTLEKSAKHKGSNDIIRYETVSGERSVLVSAEQLVPTGLDTPLTIASYEWSSNRQLLLIFTNTKRVWRRNTRGDYWLLDLQSGDLKQLGTKFPESTLMFTKFSPDDAKVAYVSEHNLYVEDLQSNDVVALTTDGTSTLINGTFDWAYEEEFGCRDGFRWSPDGKNIAYWQIDAANIRIFNMINNTDSLYSFTVPVQYPKVGEDPSSAKVGIVSASGGQTTWVPVPGSSVQNYLPRMMWAPDSKSVMLQQINRKQNTNKLWSYSISSQAIDNVFTDQDKAWLDVVDDWIWFDKGKEFSWLSDKDGWRHFYRISSKGDAEQLVTIGDYDVIQILEINDKNGYVYFIASPDNPTQRYLYRTPLNGSGKMEQLSPETQPGSHSYQIAPGGAYAFHTYSNINTPPTIDLVSLPKHKTVRVLVDNIKTKEAVEILAKENVEFFKVKTVDDVEMDGFIIRPPEFDENKKYPVLFYVYGEPAGQTARDSWGGSGQLWFYMLAQQGYIVITMDNRGTPSPKGRAWRKSLYRKIGVVNSRDQAMAVNEVSKWKFVDSDRIGVWGWSGGGSMTLNLLFRYPEIYKMGMSVAPVGNQLLYDNIYQERYMGLPSENMEDYVEGSPLTYAKNLKGNLLLVHGTGDDNVHYQNSEIIINELIKSNIQFDLMSYPNRSHGIREGKNTTRHLRTLLTRYLNEHLEPGGEPNLIIEKK
jgi:dipeptidyl-peptidase-4